MSTCLQFRTWRHQGSELYMYRSMYIREGGQSFQSFFTIFIFSCKRMYIILSIQLANVLFASMSMYGRYLERLRVYKQMMRVQAHACMQSLMVIGDMRYRQSCCLRASWARILIYKNDDFAAEIVSKGVFMCSWGPYNYSI
jgi:hypothetical protein